MLQRDFLKFCYSYWLQNICDIAVLASLFLHLSISANFSYSDNYRYDYKIIFLGDEFRRVKRGTQVTQPSTDRHGMWGESEEEGVAKGVSHAGLRCTQSRTCFWPRGADEIAIARFDPTYNFRALSLVVPRDETLHTRDPSIHERAER